MLCYEAASYYSLGNGTDTPVPLTRVSKFPGKIVKKEVHIRQAPRRIILLSDVTAQ
jgi:hypothetical protein